MREPKIGGLSVSNLASTLGTIFPSLSSGKNWDREYASGGWDRLNSDDELGRYAVIMGLLTRLSPAPAVLDVGCGSGRMLQLLSRIELGRYLGVDLSAEAIQRARELQLERASFEVASGETFETSEQFDAVVFNEVAYYLRQPGKVLLRYASYLRPGGLIVVSMFQCLPATLAWRKLAREFETTDATKITNRLGRTWNIRVLRARGTVSGQ